MDSSRTPDRETTPNIHHYIADKLNSAIFSGWYTERIWIEGVQQYRDEIKVDEDEVQMNKILRSVSRRVKKLHPKFTGIDGTKDQMSLYVDWSNQEQIIGHYWFLIEKAFLGKDNHVIFELRILRSVSGSEKTNGRCPHCGKLPLQDSASNNSQSKNNIDDPLSLTEIAKQIQWRFRDVITPCEWWTDIKPHLNLENVFKFGKFLIVLFMAAFTGVGHFIIHIASHTNRFVHGLSGLIRSMTPFLLACVDTINRCLAGIFTLIAMIWKDVRKPQVQTQNTANRLTFDRNEARKNFLEGPGGPGSSYPYRRENQNRPYM